MCRMLYKTVFPIIVVAVWSICHVSMVAAAEVAPPQSIMQREISTGLQPATDHSTDADSGSVILPSYLAPAQYIVIEIEPAAGHSFSKGYGINNFSQVVGRTYNYNDVTQEVEDQRALFWDLHTGSVALTTLDGISGGWGINDTGMATGFSTDAGGNERAVRWNLGDGSILDLGTLTNPSTMVVGDESYCYRGINNSHTVVGHSEIPNDDGLFIPFHGFIYDDANGMRDLGTLTTDSYYMGGYSIAYDMTEANTVVGIANAAGWIFRPFIWTEQAGMSQLPVDSTRASGEWYATVINESGMIGGHVIDGTAYYPYYWTSKDDAPAAMTMPVAYPNGENYGLNENGQMVGGMFNSADEDRAFIFDTTNGVVDLNDRIGVGTGWQLLTAVDINDMGQITGIGELNGVKRAFLLTPHADTDADGDIDGSDIAALAQEMGTTACSGGCSCDFNDDDAVTDTDALLQAMVLGHTS